jgi:hypothetical protein
VDNWKKENLIGKLVDAMDSFYVKLGIKANIIKVTDSMVVKDDGTLDGHIIMECSEVDEDGDTILILITANSIPPLTPVEEPENAAVEVESEEGEHEKSDVWNDRICSGCDGTGIDKRKDDHICTTCKGAGMVGQAKI